MMRRIVLLSSVTALAAFGQKYDGPRPTRSDLPYIRHADHLVATEAVAAKEEHKKNETIYIMEGANSTAKTPLAMPVFVLLADKLTPERLGLYRLESKGGHREVVFDAKKPPEAIRIEVKHLDGKLYLLAVGDGLDPGEYALSAEGSNQAFCFQVF
jgi:hypothetical protein